MSKTPRKTHRNRSSRKQKARPSPPSSPDTQAHKIADAVGTAWHRAHGTGRLDVPVSVVATLAAAAQYDSEGNDNTTVIIEWSCDAFLAYARRVWRSAIRHRPDTTHLLYPIIRWLFDDVETSCMLTHAHTVAQTALRAGQLDLTGTDRRFATDLLGSVLTVLRPQGDLQARGQYYTPKGVAGLLASLSDIDEYGSIEDPMMGTGGLFRAVAETMRHQHRDPHTMTWVGCDQDELAVACATVNSMIWNLGHDIVFYAGNTFTQDWKDIAMAQRTELRRLATEIERHRGTIALLKNL